MFTINDSDDEFDIFGPDPTKENAVLGGKKINISKKNPEITREALVFLFNIPIASEQDSFDPAKLKPLDLEDLAKKLEDLGGENYKHFKEIVYAYNQLLVRQDSDLKTFFNELEDKRIIYRPLLDILRSGYKKFGKISFIKFLSKELILASFYLLSKVLKALLKAVLIPSKYLLREVFCLFTVIVVLLVAVIKFIIGPNKFPIKKMNNIQRFFFGKTRACFTKHELKYSLELVFKAAFLNGGSLIKAKKALSGSLGRSRIVWCEDGVLPTAGHMEKLQTMLLGE